MRSSSLVRQKHSFIPWLAALVLGASAHAGWLIHELRSDHDPQQAHSDRSRARDCCRGLAGERPAGERDLDLFVQQTDRHHYVIDRRALEQLTVAELNQSPAQLDIIARSLRLAAPIELRNIDRGTQLWLIGLRNGDRIQAITTAGEPTLERVELELLRRGRPLALVYELI